jgi:Heterokaryon incompatibility protein (HET)
MGEIYKSANNVIVWLGKKDEFTKDALTAIRRLSRIPQDKYSHVKVADWHDQGAVLRKLGTSPLSYTHWLGLVAFLNRPWFKRAWVAHETILARNVVVICGRAVISWAMISKVVSFLIATGWHDQLHTEKMKPSISFKRNPGLIGDC